MTLDVDGIVTTLTGHLSDYEAWDNEMAVSLILHHTDGYGLMESKVLSSVLEQIRTANPDINDTGALVGHLAKMMAIMNDTSPNLPWFPQYQACVPMPEVFAGIVLVAKAWVVHGADESDRGKLPDNLGDHPQAREIVQASAHLQGDEKIMVVRYRDDSNEMVTIRSDVHGGDALAGEIPDALKRVFRHVRAHVNMHPFPGSPQSQQAIITEAGKLADELEERRGRSHLR